MRAPLLPLPAALLLALPAPAQELEAQLVGSVAHRPTAIACAPGVTDQLYVATKRGIVWIFRNGTYVNQPFLDVTGSVNSNGENGMLGMAFDPDYSATSNRWVYVYYTTGSGDGDSMLSRFEVPVGSDDSADAMSEQILWGPIAQQTNGHKGGKLQFGVDGMLYLALGDGDAGSAMNLGTAQDLSDPRGSILRFDVDAPHPHVPADNPFVGMAGHDEHIWAYGFRNPFRLDVDPVTGDVYVGDVGGGRWEEITRLPAGVGGLNGGWPCMEGPECRSHAACSCPSASLTGPIVAQSHSSDPFGCAIIGGVLYRGSAIPSLYGKYFFGDFCTGKYFTVDDPAGAATVTEVTADVNPASQLIFAVDFARDHEGEIYVAEHYSAEIWKIVPRCGFQSYCSSNPNSSGNPATLSIVGSASIAAADMTLNVDDLPLNAFGFFLVSESRNFVPNFSGSQGILCIGGSSQILRWSLRIQDSGATGSVSMFTDLTDLPSLVDVAPGRTWNFQYWTRDANPSVTSNTSDAVAVTFCP